MPRKGAGRVGRSAPLWLSASILVALAACLPRAAAPTSPGEPTVGASQTRTSEFAPTAPLAEQPSVNPTAASPGTQAYSRPRAIPQRGCAVTSTSLVPLTDLAGTYEGQVGGLYGASGNVPPEDYLAQGLSRARLVQPRSVDGTPSATGVIGVVAIGMSNTAKEFSAFEELFARPSQEPSRPPLNPRVRLVNAAQSAIDLRAMARPNADYWGQVDDRLRRNGVTAAQVQVVWLKNVLAEPSEAFEQHKAQLVGGLLAVIYRLYRTFPNMQLVFLSSRTYGGYATTSLHPEPYAYESAFAVREVVARRMAGNPAFPWMGWGPYLWTNGTAGRSDGLAWDCADTDSDDGTHPSRLGEAKVAQQLWQFFTTSPLTRSWFIAGP